MAKQAYSKRHTHIEITGALSVDECLDAIADLLGVVTGDATNAWARVCGYLNEKRAPLKMPELKDQGAFNYRREQILNERREANITNIMTATGCDRETAVKLVNGFMESQKTSLPVAAKATQEPLDLAAKPKAEPANVAEPAEMATPEVRTPPKKKK